MKRLRSLIGVALAVSLAAIIPSPPSLAASPIDLETIADQVLEIYPGLVKTTPTTVRVSVNPANARLTVQATSADKVKAVTTAGVGGSIQLTPTKPGTAYVKVTAALDGYDTTSQTFAVKVVSKTETEGYDWTGEAKVGGSGLVTGTKYSPTEPNVLYAMTNIGGAFRYDFDRNLWIGLNDNATDIVSEDSRDAVKGPGPSATFVTAIQPDPVQTGRVYMTAGRDGVNNLLRSDDYGNHWTQYDVPGMAMDGNGGNRGSGPDRLAIDPKHNSTLYP